MTIPSAIESPVVLYATFPRRLLAMLVDGLVLLTYLLLLGLVGGVVDLGPYLRSAMFLSLLLAGLLYEPVCVAAWGQTLGHRALNLRVVADTPTGRLQFWRALLRWLLKVTTGVASFVTMAATRRHQALHDLPFRTTVQIADSSWVAEGHYHLERPPLPLARLPSRLRRVLVILGYVAVSMVLYTLAAVFTLPEECVDGAACSRDEQVAFDVLATVWLACAVLVVALGWQGRLWGCRRVPMPPDATPRG